MKVTALLPEDMINDVKKFSRGKNITESLQIALSDYIQRQKLRKAIDRKSTRLNSSHIQKSRMPSSA